MDIKQKTIDKIETLEYIIGEIKNRMSVTSYLKGLASYQSQIDYYEEQLKDLNNYLNDLK